MSAEKSKMMTFRRGEGRKKRERWDEEIEVDRFKYLSYTLQRNNNTDRHIKETYRKNKDTEEKIKGESNNELLKKCLTEIEKEKQNKTRWETDTQMYFRRKWYVRNRSKKN